MILEEFIGGVVALISSLFAHSPPISREGLQREYRLIFETNPEQDEVYDGLIHREYEEVAHPELRPYYDEDVSVCVQDGQPRRNLCESFLRSCKTNIGLVMAASLILGTLTIGLVNLDLNTSNSCVEWMYHNLTSPPRVRMVRMVGKSLQLIPVFGWFSVNIIMLWGFREFKKNYLLCLFLCQLITGSATCVYGIILFDKLETFPISYNTYRLPRNFLFMLSVICGAYLVARKLKKVNPEVSYSVFRIFFILSFSVLGCEVLAYIYDYAIVKYFRETEGRMKKAVIAAVTPGMTFPVTAIAKYIALRKSSKIISTDRAFVLCYFLRGGAILLYRTMQSDFQNIWLFTGLSLLHGVSNVISKATLNFRIKFWKSFVKWCNRTCCGPRLDVQLLDSPRIRRFNADLEIQNTLFEYAAVILSQAYLVCYLVISFNVQPWDVMKGSLIRIAISLAMDFVFNIISVFIQIHFYDIPMQKVWAKYWPRHVTANAYLIILAVSYFGSLLVSAFAGRKYISNGYKLRNCTSAF